MVNPVTRSHGMGNQRRRNRVTLGTPNRRESAGLANFGSKFLTYCQILACKLKQTRA
jgi:hypothetical protein